MGVVGDVARDWVREAGLVACTRIAAVSSTRGGKAPTTPGTSCGLPVRQMAHYGVFRAIRGRTVGSGCWAVWRTTYFLRTRYAMWQQPWMAIGCARTFVRVELAACECAAVLRTTPA